LKENELGERHERRRARQRIVSDSSESDDSRRCRGSCCQQKHVSEFRFTGLLSRAGKRYQHSQCKVCERDAKRVVKRIRKVKAPPVSLFEICEEEPPMRCDHDYSTGAFRGWLCGTCNRALDMLGDDVAGVRRALAYLAHSLAASSGLDDEERARSGSPRHLGDSRRAAAAPESL
jgi:hypothetical protein